MKHITAFFRMALSALASAQAAMKSVRVFIMAGRSNMEGQGFVAADSKRNGGQGSLEFVAREPATAKPFASLMDVAGRWRTRDDGWISYLDRQGPLTVGDGLYDTVVARERGDDRVQ